MFTLALLESPDPIPFAVMDRSLRAVMLGTFTLRFSTGLTGAMLVFYLARLHELGGERVDPVLVGIYSALFYVSELGLSPIFGILGDRFGHHRLMLWGPIFGGVAVILTGLSTNPVILGGTRLLEGASTAASVPAILGFIAMASAGNEAVRGRAASRFEGATLAGLGVGFIVAPKLFEALHQGAFFLNAIVYAGSFLIYLRGVRVPQDDVQAPARPRVTPRRYLQLVRSAHIWLLAPTWIAINASIGLWFSQSLFAFAERNDRFPRQMLMRGFTATEITIAAIIVAILFGAGLMYWGSRFKRFRRTTIILYGILGGGAAVAAGLVVNHGDGIPPIIVALALLVVAGGLFVLAGATPAAVGLLADVSERFPDDRGAIMGLYSVFLAIGQIGGSLVGGLFARWAGIDGLFSGTLLLLVIALVPLAQLRRQEHDVGGPGTPARFGNDEDGPAGA
jgi:MFS family permease